MWLLSCLMSMYQSADVQAAHRGKSGERTPKKIAETSSKEKTDKEAQEAKAAEAG